MRRPAPARLLALSAALAAAVALGGCAASGGSTEPASSASDHGGAEHGGSTATATAGTANEADIAYAMGMAAHHEQAVEMSEIVLAHDGLDERVADLAERIRDAQGPEIAQMEAWLEAWGADTSDMAGHGDHGMAGMQSEEDLQAMRDADAGDAQVLFLKAMVEHHEGALDMAEAHLEEGADPDALALSEQVIATQRAEIDEMRALLDELA